MISGHHIYLMTVELSNGNEQIGACLFFFSSRRRHTRLQGDWSSDVCSSNLGALCSAHVPRRRPAGAPSSFTSLRRAPHRPAPDTLLPYSTMGRHHRLQTRTLGDRKSVV